MRRENSIPAATSRFSDSAPRPTIPPVRQLLPTIVAVIVLLASSRQSLAADPEFAVSGFQVDCIAIRDARIVTAPGTEIEKATLVIRRGTVESVGSDVVPPADARVIDGTNLIVYAGFIDAARDDLWNRQNEPRTQPGRTVDAARYALAGTPEDNRRGLHPEFKLESNLQIPRDKLASLHQSGMTLAHIVRSEPIIGGQGCIVSLSGAPAREAVLPNAGFVTIDLLPPAQSSGETLYPSTPMGATAHLRQALLDAHHHARHRELYSSGANGISRPPQDDVLESLYPLLEGRLRSLFRADSADRIDRSLDLAAEFKLNATIWGGRQAWKRLDRLKDSNTAVVFDLDFGDSPEEKAKKDKPRPVTKGDLTEEEQPPQRVRDNSQKEWTEGVAGAKRLDEAGVPFAFSTRSLKDGEFLPQVRKLIQAGLSSDAALAALTTRAAEILGVGEKAGRLEPGRVGNAIVMTHPFHEDAAKVRFAIVDGYVYEYGKEETKKDEPSPESTPEAAAALAGSWDLTIQAGEKSKTKATLNFSAAGSRLDGEFRSEQGAGKVISGRAGDSKLTFKVEIGAGDKQITLEFEGKHTKEVDTERLEGTLSSAFGAPATWTAIRTPTTDDKKPDTRSAEPGAVKLSLETDSDSAQPEKSKTDSLPSELWTDRHRRSWQTNRNMLLRGGTILTGTGGTLRSASILVRDGKIIDIGPRIEADEGMSVIDVAGWYVMPGIVDTHSHIMIGPGMGGVNEFTQSIVCEVRIGDVIRSDDPKEYRAVSGGVTTARLLHGSANTIGGQHAVVKLKVGATAREHLVEAPPGVKFALGENVKSKTGRFPNTRMGVEATIKRAFYEALDYRTQWADYERTLAASDDATAQILPPRRDLRLEMLVALLNGESFIHCHCYRADEILMLLRTADDLGIRIRSLQHVLEGYKVAPEIAAHGASCSTFADWWAYKIEAYDATPYNTSALHRAGANVVVKSDDAELMRHLNHEAAKSLRYGNMPPDDALRMVTANAARELGLHDRIGSIEVGKDADFAVFNAHPMNAFARCEMTIIDGEVVFRRDASPSAMSAEAQLREVRNPGLPLAPAEVRERKLELPESKAGTYAIVGAIIHPVDGPVIERGDVLVRNDKIAALGRGITIPEDATRIDARGMHVYPGLIDAGTTLGIHEIRQLRVTNDEQEIGRFQPDLRTGIAVNAESELVPVSRAGGITLALAHPTGGVLSGQSSLVQTGGWTAESMVRRMSVGLHLNWPNDQTARDELDRFIEDARVYDAARQRDEQSIAEEIRKSPAAALMDKSSIVRDPRFEAIRPFIRAERPIFIEANSRKEIAAALNFAAKHKLRIVLTGAADAWKLADVLAERGINCIVGPTMRDPVEEWDTFDATYANPGRLHEAGVPFCIRSNNPSNSRNVAFEAAIAVAYGLPEGEALRAITINSAKILGVADSTGSIEPGKLADLIITDGSPLQHSTQIKAIFVAGVPYAPESRQTRLYEKYLERLK